MCVCGLRGIYHYDYIIIIFGVLMYVFFIDLAKSRCAHPCRSADTALQKLDRCLASSSSSSCYYYN